MENKYIPVAAPMLVGNEKEYVDDCLTSTWISSTGKYVDLFESAFAEFSSCKNALSCCNGTTALHLALAALDLGPDDEVIVPTLSFVATANVVRYCGARPVFVDVEADTWNIEPAAIEEKITSRTRGIMPVHLYGNPADMVSIMEIAKQHGLFVVEDAAEAHGAEINGQRVGSFGDISAFSFYGNKVITTGEGGMLVTNDDALAARARHLRAQGTDGSRRYWHSVVGYNYRMTNVAAAIGLAQLEKIDWHLKRRFEIAASYRELLKDVPQVTWQVERDGAKSIYWMFTVTLDDSLDRDEVASFMQERGIDTRPIFYPIHTLPPYQEADGSVYPVSERISRRGLSLPTWAGLTDEDVRYVTDCLQQSFESAKCLSSVNAAI